MRIPKKEDTDAIISKLYDIFYKGSSWKLRYLYLAIGSQLTEYFSFSKYRDYKVF